MLAFGSYTQYITELKLDHIVHRIYLRYSQIIKVCFAHLYLSNII